MKSDNTSVGNKTEGQQQKKQSKNFWPKKYSQPKTPAVIPNESKELAVRAKPQKKETAPKKTAPAKAKAAPKKMCIRDSRSDLSKGKGGRIKKVPRSYKNHARLLVLSLFL